jgi:hypothetical protein
VPIANSLSDSAIPHDVCLETFRRKSYAEPEEKLMLAVLDDAIACLRKYAFARDRKGKGLFQEAENWVQETNRDWLVSFVNVCEVLGFAPEYLRRGLGQWKAAKLERRAKPRSATAKTAKTRDLTDSSLSRFENSRNLDDPSPGRRRAMA